MFSPFQANFENIYNKLGRISILIFLIKKKLVESTIVTRSTYFESMEERREGGMDYGFGERLRERGIEVLGEGGDG